MRGFEERVLKRVGESVEELAEILKDYARKQRKVSERLGDVETKLFGGPRTGADKRK